LCGRGLDSPQLMRISLGNFTKSVDGPKENGVIERQTRRALRRLFAWASIGVLLFAPLQVEAQAPATFLRRIQWPLLDLIVFPDSCVGLRVMVAPNPASTAWLAGTRQVQLGLDPIEALQWTTVARRLTQRAAAATGEPDTAARLTPPLRPRRGSQLLLLAVNEKASAPDQRYIFVVSDSGSDTHWKAFASLAQVDSLLTAFEDAVDLARAIPIATDASQAFTEDDPSVERPVAPESIPVPKYPSELRRKGHVGRVWMQYIVGPDGRAETGSFRVLLSDDPQFTAAAAQAIYRGTFRPALSHGAPVRQRVFQTITFRLRG
jgi:TonB family protein